MTDQDDTGAVSEATEPPKSAKKYLETIADAERAFATYQTRCDNIDRLYADLDGMAKAVGDREFKIFWANMEVLKPTIYARPPVAVVVPRKRGAKNSAVPQPVAMAAAEILEGAMQYDVDADDLHETLLLVRDDLAINGRGVPWVLDSGSCIHVDRRDFLHDPARKWPEVGWVARRAYLTRDEIAERFPGANRRKIKFETVKRENSDDYEGTDKKAQVWEIWNRAENVVIWVTPDYPDVLDARDPMISVKGFFPCPKPAYATCERRTLKPVPDFVYYRDQVDEINELTARISSLAESLRVKGFYASGTSEVGEAIETAMKSTDSKAIMVPVSNFAALGGAALKDAVVWLPVEQVAKVITDCVALRRQLIEDVYEITGLSDIMRGSTEASETATAQNLKAQYGSVRVRERQAEMTRVARDILRIKAEILAENHSAADLSAMAQIRLPSQQEMLQAQAQGQDVSKVVPIEAVDRLLKDERIRPFVLDVESDSTIAPNEEAEKKARIEFITAVGGFINQAGAMVAQQPETAPFAAEMLKFAAGSFRGGRELMGAVDEFADLVAQKGQEAAAQRGKPTPEQEAAQQDAQLKREKMQTDAKIDAYKLRLHEVELGMKEREAERGEREVQAAESDVARLEGLEAAVAQSTAQMAQAVQMLTQQMAMVMDQMTAPRRVIRGADGSVQGVEVLASIPTTRTVDRDETGAVAGVGQLQ